MAFDFDFVVASDKPALLALSTLEWLATVQAALSELGYKVHTASNHEDFATRMTRVQYEVVFLEEQFASSTPEENLSLKHFQRLPMNQRRHAVSFLIGDQFQTLNPMQAFQNSIHAVINPAEFPSLTPIIQQTTADHDLFLRVFRETETKLAEGK
jgi:hypothetical protein